MQIVSAISVIGSCARCSSD